MNTQAIERLTFAFEMYAMYRRKGQAVTFERCLDEALFVYDNLPLPDKDDVKTREGIAIKILLTLLIGLILFAGRANAATYYTATTGSDSNPGTQSAPFLTIQKGVIGLRPGDTLYVKAGTYAENLYCPEASWVPPGFVCIPSGTSWNAPVTVAAYPGDTVTIQPNAGSNDWNYRVLAFDRNQSYIIIIGFIIDGANVGADAIQINSSAHHIRIQNCEIRNMPSNGVHVSPDANSNEILTNNIHDVHGTDHMHGIYLEGSNSLIAGNAIHHCSGYGVHIYNGYAGKSANNNTVYKNKVFQNGTALPSNSAGILLGSGSNNIAYDNLVWGNPVGIRIGFFSTVNNQALNNTVYLNTGSQGQVGIYVSSGSGAVVKNNIIYQNGTNILNNGTGTVLANNLTIDPLFVNVSAQDFHLEPGSPARDAGLTLGVVPDDFDGLARPQGTAYDIGAYEGGGSPPNPPLNPSFTFQVQ